ncbi:hypothetical protein LJR098_002595 [Rhizobium sp. LjRoot98]|uniref:hypothetical protein n=1 Tax=Rhizobium sp. LjRoot98 TaxID=3342345 RepID=UPI003ECF1B1A
MFQNITGDRFVLGDPGPVDGLNLEMCFDKHACWLRQNAGSIPCHQGIHCIQLNISHSFDLPVLPHERRGNYRLITPGVNKWITPIAKRDLPLLGQFCPRQRQGETLFLASTGVWAEKTLGFRYVERQGLLWLRPFPYDLFKSSSASGSA